MHERALLPILLGTLVMAPLLARWAGWRTASREWRVLPAV